MAISRARPGGARQMHVRQIRARDEQDQANGAEQHRQRRPEAADGRIEEGVATMPQPLLVSGYCVSSRAASVESSARAASTVTPGFSRPIDAEKVGAPRPSVRRP